MRKFLLIVIALVAAFHVYLGFRLLPDLPIGSVGRIAGGLILALSCVVIVGGTVGSRTIERQSLADFLAITGYLAMGLFSCLLVLTILRDIVLAIIALTVSEPFPTLGRDSALVTIALAILMMAVGIANARRTPQVIEVDIPLRGLPLPLHGFSIAQISDIHIGPTIKGPYLSRIVDAVNRLDANIVAVTGDVVDGSVHRLAPHVASLGRLHGRDGVYLVTGNHEYYSGEPAWTAEFQRLGLRVLKNEHVVIQHGDAKLVLGGVTDFSAGQFDPTQASDPVRALAGAPSDAATRVLLAHQPRSAPAAEAAGFDLQLSGHTHGGQFWPWNHFVRLQQPFTAGLNRLKNLWVYTSRGSGYWGPPIRFLAPSEITLLVLVPAA